MRKITLSFVLGLFFIAACTGDGDKRLTTTTSGSTQIVVDESFRPIVEEQWEVFKSSYPKADIKFTYMPERQLLNAFLNDSINIAIMSRELRASEIEAFEKRSRRTRTNRFAIDAITLIANKSVEDSTITVQEIVDVMQGKNTSINLVFDNANSSIVRYLKDLAQVNELPEKGVYALKSNLEVIKYVHNNTGAFGVIGVNWIKLPEKEFEPLVRNIKILGVKNLPGMPGSDRFYKPSQDNLALERYPLRRGIYIINGLGASGLGTGFASFLASDRGQRIVLKSGLMPDSLPTREILIR